MLGNLEILNSTAFLEQLSEMRSGKRFIPSISSKDFRILECKTRPRKGFVLPEGFPYCCDNHKKLLHQVLDHFNNFPNCCEWHKKLLQAQWFNKTDYAYFPIKLLLTYTYTCHCIDSCMDNENWFKEITDYIDYTKYSFGQMPDGYGCPLGQNNYLSLIHNYISNNDKIPTSQKDELNIYIEKIKGGSQKENEKEIVDLNALVALYKDWLNIFPFEIHFFKGLKSHFEKRIPILKGPQKTNMYTGVSFGDTISVSEMATFLTNTTKELLREVNSAALFDKGLLSDPDQVLIDIIVAKRKLSLKKYETFNTNISTYQTLLSEWFKDEKEFLNEIIPVLKRKQESKQFIDCLIEGLFEMQRQDVNVQAIRDIKNNSKKDESGFRFFMKTFLKGSFLNAVLSSEEVKGNGRIDLKITESILGEKIIEFKGWWNNDKSTIVQQICSYLTDVNKEGYIIIINQNQHKSIVDEYKTLATDRSTYCIEWQVLQYPGTAFTYYKSIHQFPNATKEVFHLVYNVYSSTERKKS